jgi:uncharacterized membrane protein
MMEFSEVITVVYRDISDPVTSVNGDISRKEGVKEDQVSLILIFVLLVLLFIISISSNVTILLAFCKKKSLRTITNRWVVLQQFCILF